MGRPGDVCGDLGLDGIHPNALENLLRNNPDHPLVAGPAGGGDGGRPDDNGAVVRFTAAGDPYHVLSVTLGAGDYVLLKAAAAQLGVKPVEVLAGGGLDRAHKVIAGLVREPGPA